MTVEFHPMPGPHRLEHLTRWTIAGAYQREPDGSVCIITLWATEKGQGHCRAFLDDLPHDETIVFDNVVSPILQGALSRRGFVFEDDGSNCWVRTPHSKVEHAQGSIPTPGGVSPSPHGPDSQ